MTAPQNFTFTDLGDGDEVWVGLRSVEGGVGLALSKKSDGDFEVFMPPESCGASCSRAGRHAARLILG
jgi:hypothetical protein